MRKQLKSIIRSGHQEYVRYCPNCRGDIRPVNSLEQPAKRAHRYQCYVCGREFEINEIIEEQRE